MRFKPPRQRVSSREDATPRLRGLREPDRTSTFSSGRGVFLPGIESQVERAKVLGHNVLGAVQRDIDTAAFQRSRNNLYLIDPSSDAQLISRDDADAPLPTSLYSMKKERDAETGELLKVWTPNVRFLSNSESDKVKKGDNLGDGFYNYGGLWGAFISSPVNVESLRGEIEEIGSGEGDLPATEGILGKNDCKKFASILQNSIAIEKVRNEEPLDYGESPRLFDDIGQANPNDLKVGVGDSMTHVFPKSASCEYHAATVVAKDGPSLVTLDGHVSKDLQRPQFHIRGGVSGFVKNNNMKKDLGKQVQIDPLGSGNVSGDREIFEETYSMMRGGSRHYTEEDLRTALSESLGVTRTDSMKLDEVREELSHDIARLYGYGEKERQSYENSAEAKRSAVIRLNSKKKPTPSYFA